MLQRFQSLFLGLIFLLLIASLFFRIWEKQNPNTGEKAFLNAWEWVHTRDTGEKSSHATVYICILALASAFLSAFILTRHHNRKQQLWLCILLDLLLVGTAFSMILTGYEAEKLFSPSLQKPENFKSAVYLVIAAMVCNLIAKRLIRRDELLVRDADRLR